MNHEAKSYKVIVQKCMQR